MGSRVIPTLAFMADVYRQSTAGGPESPRFRAYAAAATERRPVHGYNPMTSKPVLETVEALLAFDAEDVVAEAAAAVAGPRDLELFVTVATPGMWTERFGTEVHHRTVAQLAAREGRAYDCAGLTGEFDPLVADALDVVGDDEGIGTTAALLYGDDVAIHLGWTPLGLGPLAGYHHAIATAAS